MDIAKNSIKYFHVVETFRYVMRHGYRPSDKMNAVIASLCAEYKLGVGGISVFLYSISSVLLFLCPNSMLQCEWNMGKLPALTTYSNLEGVLQDLNEELEEELRNRRRKLAKKLGIDAETKLHNTELATELKFWDEPLQLKIFNGPAWDQRLNVVIKYKMKMEDKVRHGQLEDEVREAKERISKVLKDEVCYAKECILKNLENKHAWLYLKSLYTLIRADKMDPIFRDCSLDDLFKSIFEDQNLLPKNIASLTRLIDHEFDIVKNERKLLCSLDALLHLLSFGYKPAIRVQFAVKRLNPPMQGGGTLLRCIYLVLALLQPLRAHHWKWLMEQVCSQRPPLSYL